MNDVTNSAQSIPQSKTHKYIGNHVTDLATPSLILSRPIMERNISKLHDDVRKMGISFRPHVKTLKCSEVTEMMLDNGTHSKVVASTVAEMWGMMDLVKKGIVKEVCQPLPPFRSHDLVKPFALLQAMLTDCKILYGVPLPISKLPELAELSHHVRIALMIDHKAHIDALDSSGLTAGKKISVFIKVDFGYKRAGIPPDDPRLKQLIEATEDSEHVEIAGFYCHAGQSYGSRSMKEAAKLLHEEVAAAKKAAELMRGDREVILSVGATPTAHVVSELQASLPERMKLELHAGNFPCNDLQQVATGLVAVEDQAVRVVAEVCSLYPDRNEALFNAGTIALAREPGHFPGAARVVDAPHWIVGRQSQEHGILTLDGNSVQKKVEEEFQVGQKVLLHIQHACITAAAYRWYFVVDANDIVREVWFPWRGW